MDWAGVLPAVIALAALLTAFNEAGKLAAANWFLVAVLVIVGAAGAVVFWNVEKKVAHPLVPVHYLRQRRTWALLTTTLLTMTGVFAVMNGLIPNLGQDANVGAGMDADSVSWVTLTPYAIAGLVFGPVAGALAAKFGYRLILQVGLVGTVAGLFLGVWVVGVTAPWTLLLVSVFVGVTYAGISNIMLNGLGIVLSPADNPGYLPGMNAAAFNLGAGLSFAVLFAVLTALSETGADGTTAATAAGYSGGILTGAVILVAALLTSFLIPRPESLTDNAAAADLD